MEPRQPSHPAMTVPTMCPFASATMSAPGSRRTRLTTTSEVSVDVACAASRQKAKTPATSSVVAGRSSVGTGQCYEPDRRDPRKRRQPWSVMVSDGQSAFETRLEHLGPVADVDRHGAGDTQRVLEDP